MCQSNSGESHWVVAKEYPIMPQRTKDIVLIYGGEEYLIVNDYNDALLNK
jgi:hypothetical protein